MTFSCRASGQPWLQSQMHEISTSIKLRQRKPATGLPKSEYAFDPVGRGAVT